MSLNDQLYQLVIDKNKKYTREIKKAGCKCKTPNVIFSPGKGIRCRNCDHTLLNLQSLKDEVEGV